MSVEERLARLEAKVDTLCEMSVQTKDIIKYIVVPLIIGSFMVIGIKLTLP
jgi:hypothetical protein